MNQRETTSTHSVDLEALRLHLEEDRKLYYYSRFSQEGHKRLLHTLQTNDCREIITAVVDGDGFANTFLCAGGRNHINIIQAFLNHGMNIDIKNQYDMTALMEASYYGHEECVRLLLDHSASVDAQDNKGYTALIYASKYGKTKIVEMLLAKNANPDLQSKDGKTALMFSSKRGHKEVVQLLLNHGADIELKNEDRKIALDLAEDEEIKELLLNHVNSTYVLK